MIPAAAAEWLASIGGRGSALHQKHYVYLQIATVATLPENCSDRLAQVFVGEFERLRNRVRRPVRFRAEQERDSNIDMEDVKHLARAETFDLNTRITA